MTKTAHSGFSTWMLTYQHLDSLTNVKRRWLEGEYDILWEGCLFFAVDTLIFIVIFVVNRVRVVVVEVAVVFFGIHGL